MAEPPFRFELLSPPGRSGPRRGRLHSPHGTVETPCYAPVGTYGAVKGLLPRLLAETGTELVLANALHLSLRPGHRAIARLGGLHRFMGWERVLLTDSGGYQIFSLAERCLVDEDGVTFASPADGSTVRLTPESALEIQRDLGPDIAMVLDHCAPPELPADAIRAAHHRTLLWARRSADLHRRWGGVARGQAVFAIVQGGTLPELREESAAELAAMDFDGYAVGGLMLGEPRERTLPALSACARVLPPDRPRYLMGAGTPEDFREAVARGMDLFDCVTATRHGRTAQAFTRHGRLNLRNARYASDPSPLDPDCRCEACRSFSRAYLRHLHLTGEMLGGILVSLHNIHYFQEVMGELRAAAERGEAPRGGTPGG